MTDPGGSGGGSPPAALACAAPTDDGRASRKARAAAASDEHSMSVAARPGTAPATIAATALAAGYAGFAGWVVYFVRLARAQGLESPALETWFHTMATIWALLAVLWIWTATCCLRRKPSRIFVVTIGLTAVEIAFFLVTSLLSSLQTSDWPDPIEAIRTLLEVALVVVVSVWRPRGAVPR